MTTEPQKPAAPLPEQPFSMEELFTRERANDGIDVALSYPNGKPTPYKIRIRGIDSDEVRAAQLAAQRKIIDVAAQDEKQVEAALAEARLSTLVSYVISWTLPTECTPENVRKLMREAPQIAERIDRLAANRALFFAKSLSDSVTTPASSSS